MTKKSEINNSRIQWIDMAKGYGIVLVLLGHLHVNEMMVWIYSFHMPLFFFLSGYLFSVKSSFREFAAGKVRKLLVPYLALYIPAIVSELYFHSQLSWSNLAGCIPLVITQQRHAIVWFLGCIIVLHFLFYPIVRYCRNPIWGILITLLMGLTGVILWRNGITNLYWNCDVALVVAPFFYGGYLMKGKVDQQRIRRLSPWRMWPGAALLLVASVSLAHLNSYIGLGREVDLFDSLYSEEWLTYPTACVGIALTLVVAARVSVPAISYIGRSSLLFYTWHYSIVMLPITHLMARLGITRLHEGIGGMLQNALILAVTLAVLAVLNELIGKSRLKFIVGK